MTLGTDFFLIFLGTIVITRLFLFLKPISSPTIGNFRLHHYMYGIVGVILGIVLSSIYLYAIGLALFIDELTLIFIIRGKSHEENYSAKSLLGTLFFVMLVFLFRNYLVMIL